MGQRGIQPLGPAIGENAIRTLTRLKGKRSRRKAVFFCALRRIGTSKFVASVGCHWLLVSQCERVQTVELKHDAWTMHNPRSAFRQPLSPVIFRLRRLMPLSQRS